jgi:hypothetical protein
MQQVFSVGTFFLFFVASKNINSGHVEMPFSKSHFTLCKVVFTCGSSIHV